NRRPEVQVVEFSFLEEAFRAAEDGRADAVLAEAPSARAILNRMGRSGAFTSRPRPVPSRTSRRGASGQCRPGRASGPGPDRHL
ncbi:MAG: hypothetical protein ACLFPR_13850, partial [Desulfococcaceae bacterium]